VGTGAFIVNFAASKPAQTFTDSIQYSVSVNQKKVVTAIKIVDGFQVQYTKGEVPTYQNLSIVLLNSDGENLGYLLAKDNSSITYSTIDTSVATTSGTFTVTYTPSDGSTPLTASLTYIVKNVSYLTNWSSNQTWTDFQNANKNVDATMDGRESFMATTSFKLGTLSSLNLCPVVQEYDAAEDEIVTHNSLIPEGTTISLKKDGTTVALSDYFSEANLFLLKNRGDVKFNDNAAEGSYALTFSYKDGKSSSFPDIVYSFDLLHAYNVTTAAELMVANTESTAFIENDIKDFKDSNGIPTTIFSKVIIQKDIDLSKDAIPSSFLWDKNSTNTKNVPQDTSYSGSLKDWTYFYTHTLTDANPTFELYGNFHKVTMTNLPFIQSDSSSPSNNNGATHDNTKPMEPHASLFLTINNNIVKASNGTYRSLFQDVAFYGDQGVDGAEKWKTNAGVIFDKPFDTTVFKNVNANHFFTTAVNGGYAGYTADGATTAAVRDPKLYIYDSRLHDTFSTMIFNYSASSTYCFHSELMNAGGPLVINQSPSYKMSPDSTKDEPNTNTKNAYNGTWFYSDSTSHLENYVTGQGGWFDLYGATSAFAGIGSISDLFAAKFGTTFKFTVDNVSKFNFICLNMGLTGSMTGSDPAFYGGTSLDGTASSTANYWASDYSSWPTITDGFNYIDYGKKEDLATYLPNGQTSITSALAKYDFVDTWLQQDISDNSTRAPFFKTMDSKKNPQFLLGNINLQDSSKSVFYDPVKALEAGLGAQVDPTAFDDDQKAIITGSKYLGVYYDMMTAAKNDDITTYAGSSAFGLVFGYGKVSNS
jgi:hypothetical protein